MCYKAPAIKWGQGRARHTGVPTEQGNRPLPGHTSAFLPALETKSFLEGETGPGPRAAVQRPAPWCGQGCRLHTPLCLPCRCPQLRPPLGPGKTLNQTQSQATTENSGRTRHSAANSQNSSTEARRPGGPRELTVSVPLPALPPDLLHCPSCLLRHITSAGEGCWVPGHRPAPAGLGPSSPPRQGAAVT